MTPDVMLAIVFFQYGRGRGGNAKNKKKKVRSDFIIDEAEVDDDTEETEDMWEDDGGIGEDGFANEADEAGRTARDIEARMRKERGERGGGLGFDDEGKREKEKERENLGGGDS